MIRSKHILLFIGSAGLAAAIFGLVKGGAFEDHLMTIVCATCLIYGYFQMKSAEHTSD